MNIEYPTTLLEFILSGILFEVLILILIPTLEIGDNIFWILTLISSAYVCGLGINAIATLFFTELFETRIRKKTFEANIYYLDNAKDKIFTIFNVDLKQDQNEFNYKEMNCLIRRMSNYLEHISDEYKIDLKYQNRIYRMARTAFIILIFWLFFILITGIFDIIPTNEIIKLYHFPLPSFWILIVFILLMLVSIFFAVLYRIKYIAGIPIWKFSGICNIK